MMTSYSPKKLERKLKKSGLDVVFSDGWEDVGDPFGVSPDAGIIVHHTANGGARGNNPSVYWQINNQYYPTRAAHFNIGRDGLVTVIAGRGCYHAGASTLPEGGMNVAGVFIPSVSGNKRLVGIEIESKGTNATTKAAVTDVDGYTPQQIKSAVTLAALLCELMDRPAESVINHGDWAPGRKNDTLLPMKWWQKKVKRKIIANKAKRLIRKG